MIEQIALTPITTDDRNLLVSTIKIRQGRYDTVVFDESANKQHAGKRIGRWVINSYSEWTTDRESAMDAHRDALRAARHEPISA
jgi:hypothetical protein